MTEPGGVAGTEPAAGPAAAREGRGRRRGCCLGCAVPGVVALVCVVRLFLVIRDEAFVQAGWEGDVPTIKRMLRHGASASARDWFYQDTALHRACRRSHPEAVRVLLDAGADPNAVSDEDLTPLMENARSGDPRIAELLIKGGANVRFRNRLGDDALSWAEQTEHTEVARVIRAAGARRSAR